MSIFKKSVTEDSAGNKKDARKADNQISEMFARGLSPSFSKLLRGASVATPVDISGVGDEDATIPMRLLTIGEEEAASMELAQWVKNEITDKKIDLSLMTPVYVTKQAVLYLERALSSNPDVKNHELVISPDVLNRMPAVALLSLMEAYRDLEAKYNPNLDVMTLEEIDQYIDEIEKKSSLVTNLTSRKLRQIVVRLIDQKTALEDKYRLSLSQIASISDEMQEQ